MGKAFLFGVFLLGFQASPAARAEIGVLSDSGIRGPSYQAILNDHAALAAAHPDWAAMVDYGSSNGGRTLRLLRIASPDAAGQRERPAVLISGSTHGNEYLNIEDRIARWLLESRTTSPGLMKFFNAGGVVYVIPILNPDGYERRDRGNLRGVDLNRDFDLIPADEQAFNEVETSTLAQYLEQDINAQELNLKVTVDYHCCAGALLFPWSYTRNSLPSAVLNQHVAIGRLMQTHIDPGYTYGSTGQVLGYYPRGTSKDYYFAKYGALAFTFEGEYNVENRNFDKHTLFWDAVLGGLVN